MNLCASATAVLNCATNRIFTWAQICGSAVTSAMPRCPAGANGSCANWTACTAWARIISGCWPDRKRPTSPPPFRAVSHARRMITTRICSPGWISRSQKWRNATCAGFCSSRITGNGRAALRNTCVGLPAKQFPIPTSRRTIGTASCKCRRSSIKRPPPISFTSTTSKASSRGETRSTVAFTATTRRS